MCQCSEYIWIALLYKITLELKEILTLERGYLLNFTS